MKTLLSQITECIESTFKIGGVDYSKRIIVFPCGDVGIQTVSILKDIYSIEPAFLIDNRKCRYSSSIHEVSYLKEIDCSEYVLLLCSTNTDIYISLRKMICDYFPQERILELESMKSQMKENPMSFIHTDIGKYSYGPICRNHMYIESIGAFCSFAEGVDVVPNHEMNCITTHPMISHGKNFTDIEIDYNFFSDKDWFFPRVDPKPVVKKRSRSIIGNDVWLGKNTIITNGANIGNGVIAGAGTIITKDIPDYAVVVGTPARIIKYRYSIEQIDSLNRIAWWDWTDDEIRERYYDFYLPVEDFVKKYSD